MTLDRLQKKFKKLNKNKKAWGWFQNRNSGEIPIENAIFNSIMNPSNSDGGVGLIGMSESLNIKDKIEELLSPCLVSNEEDVEDNKSYYISPEGHLYKVGDVKEDLIKVSELLYDNGLEPEYKKDTLSKTLKENNWKAFLLKDGEIELISWEKIPILIYSKIILAKIIGMRKFTVLTFLKMFNWNNHIYR